MRILALDVGGSVIKIGNFNENGELLHRDEISTDAYKGGQSVMKRILGIISDFSGIDRIGICCAGQIDYRSGKVIYATGNIPEWTGMEIKKIVESNFDRPVSVENDVNAAALGEAYYGVAIGEKNFICITYGTGVGGAIIENGEVYRGSNGSAGEFGHIITHAGGRKCTCGSKGCYETYASTSSLVSSIERISSMKNINGKDIFRLMQENNPTIRREVNLWIREVIIGLVSVIYVFNPSTLVLGGGIMSEGYILDYIQKNLPKQIMESFRNVSVLQTLLGNNSGLFGAVYCALNR